MTTDRRSSVGLRSPRPPGQGGGCPPQTGRVGPTRGPSQVRRRPTRQRMGWEAPGQPPRQRRRELVVDLLGSLPRPGAEVPAAMDAVLVLARASCPSCTAVSLTLDHEGQPVTLTATRGHARGQTASITVQLPRPARAPTVLVVFATDTPALIRLAADIAMLLEIPPRRITLVDDAPLPPAATAGLLLAGQLDDRATVDRALGVLLEQGWVTAQGRTELQRRADDTGTSLVQAAAAVLAALAGTPPGSPA